MTQIPQRKLKIMLIEDSDLDITVNSAFIKVADIAEDIQAFTNNRLAIEYLRTTEAENPSLLPDLIFAKVINGFSFLDDFATLSDAYKSRRPVVATCMCSQMKIEKYSFWHLREVKRYEYLRGCIGGVMTIEKLHELAGEFYSEGRSDTDCPQGQANSSIS